MKKIQIIFFLVFFSIVLPGQKYDQLWHFGNGNKELGGGIAEINFSDLEDFSIEVITDKFNLYSNSYSMADSSGSFQYVTDDDIIFDRSYTAMENGIGLVDQWNYLIQPIVSFPVPNSDSHYYLFNLEFSFAQPSYTKYLYRNTIDIRANGGLGKVIEKKKVLLEGQFTNGNLSAVKHANGRDWWILLFEQFTDKYFSILVSPDTVTISEHFARIDIDKGAGTYHFTPDGSKFIMADSKFFYVPQNLAIFDFDRCSGVLSNPKKHDLPYVDGFLVGAMTSKDSRYLYYFNEFVAYQFDLWAADIFSTQTVVATWDGTKYWDFFPVGFFIGQLAPDGRIYVNSNNGCVSLHRIEHPERAGLACEFIQNRIKSPNQIGLEMPNHPNYRLGPIDNSPCDTLGLDNHPLARWRYEQEDENSPLQVYFTDLSDYEPSTW